MTTKQNKYRIRCLTESKWINKWSNTEPVNCPNDSGHSINTEATTIIGRRGNKPIILGTDTRSVNRNNYSEICRVFYGGTNNEDKITGFKFDIDIDSGISEYTIKILDTTNNLTLSESTFTTPGIKTMIPISNIPVNEASISILGKRTSVGNKTNVNIKTIIYYI